MELDSTKLVSTTIKRKSWWNSDPRNHSYMDQKHSITHQVATRADSASVCVRGKSILKKVNKPVIGNQTYKDYRLNRAGSKTKLKFILDKIEESIKDQETSYQRIKSERTQAIKSERTQEN